MKGNLVGTSERIGAALPHKHAKREEKKGESEPILTCPQRGQTWGVLLQDDTYYKYSTERRVG